MRDFGVFFRCGKRLTGFVFFSLLATMTRVGAESGAITFDIPAQPLVTALEHFGAVSGFQILLADAGTASVRTSAIKGRFSARDALTQMVAGAGFVVRFTSERSAILIPDGPGTIASLRTAQPLALQRHEAALQLDVMQAMCSDSITRPGNYRAALDLWVGSTGQIDRVELLASTGDSVRDERIRQRLISLQSSAPPAGTAQPTTLLIMPLPSQFGAECSVPVRAGNTMRVGVP